MTDKTQNRTIEIGVKDSVGKIKFELIPLEGLKEVAKVREYGNNKYGAPWKWLEFPEKHDEFVFAALRHMLKYVDGISGDKDIVKEDIFDDESGLHHLSHAVTSILIAITLQKKYKIEGR